MYDVESTRTLDACGSRLSQGKKRDELVESVQRLAAPNRPHRLRYCSERAEFFTDMGLFRMTAQGAPAIVSIIRALPQKIVAGWYAHDLRVQTLRGQGLVFGKASV